MEEELKAEFVRNGFSFDDEEEILSKCLTFCIQYKLSASDLVSSWDVYSINRGLDFTVRSSHMAPFLEELLNEQKDKLKEKQSGLHLYSNDVAMLLNVKNEDAEVTLGSPVDEITSPFDKPPDSVSSSCLNEHLAPTEIIEEITNSDDDDIKNGRPTRGCSLSIDMPQPQPGCRFMYDRIDDKFNFLEDRIKSRAVAYANSGHFEEATDPSVASQKGIFSVGMIRCQEEGNLKEKPILLQSSVEHSGGQHVRVDLQNLSQFSLFPGQVVGVEGHNPSGHCLLASKVFDHIPLPITSSEENPAKRRLLDDDLRQSAKDATASVSLIVAAGPFTTTENLSFEPLNELLSYSLRNRPHLLVLLGPFIDSDHPEIRKGTMNQTFDELFETRILRKLQDYADCVSPSSHIILVPSTRDAHHDFIFPQPAFEVHRKGFSSNQICSISNPGTFSANEVKVACCTVDVLKHLSAEEICRNVGGGGGSKLRLNNLARHILNQQNFYPLYPPAEDLPLDFSLAKEGLKISSIPDILVLPSDLAQFVKIICLGEERCGGGERPPPPPPPQCICVNPGRLARGNGGGFFAKVEFINNPGSSTASIIRI
ncbi:hypothetical protein M569_01012 [Genlisea aurea]|uniref:DNA polymerase alpha subunit B n=1 Tax=Genlisea aurea TaxID=192259 RepID=S8D2X3_9LAMI|nr:hypothetical protein M569_01012 [Genlisea aurea]